MTRHWPLMRSILQVGFGCLVAGLLLKEAHTIDWPKVLASMDNYTSQELGLAGLLVAMIYGLFVGYEHLARRYTGHQVSVVDTSLMSFISYAFSFSLGALVGAVGMRLKLYSQFGVRASTISKIVGFCVVSNWLGCLLLGGLLLTFQLAPLPYHEYNLDDVAVRVIGVALLIVALLYIVMGVNYQGRSVRIAGYVVDVPSRPVMALQLVFSITSWMLGAFLVKLLLGNAVDYGLVLGTFLIGSVIGIVTQVPAGLGVLEAAFVVCLAGKMSEEEILAGIFAFRVCFYLPPLCLALLLYGWLALRRRCR